MNVPGRREKGLLPEMPRPLPKNATNALRAIIRGKRRPLHASTRRSLIARGLLDRTGGLTSDGWKLAVTLVRLDEQCEFMQLPLEEMHLAAEERSYPELAALHRHQDQGFIGSCCEGGAILVLIRAAALETLARLNTLDSRSDAVSRFTEAQLTILADRKRDILGAIEEATVSDVERCFEEIYADQFVRDYYPSLSCEFISALFKALGSRTLAEITDAIMEAPYEYRSGWPDLTLLRGAEIHWVEVKTTDKLHMSQIATLTHMRPHIPGQVRVVRMSRSAG